MSETSRAETSSVNRFAKNLATLMERERLTAKALSEKLLAGYAVKVPPSTLNAWKNGQPPVFQEPVMSALADLFSVSLEFLLRGTEPEDMAVKNIIDALEEGFVSVHQGVYRITVEKQTQGKAKHGGKKT